MKISQSSYFYFNNRFLRHYRPACEYCWARGRHFEPGIGQHERSRQELTQQVRPWPKNIFIPGKKVCCEPPCVPAILLYRVWGFPPCLSKFRFLIWLSFLLDPKLFHFSHSELPVVRATVQFWSWLKNIFF